MPNKGMNVGGPLNDEYQTPGWLFRALDTEFGFTVDGFATPTNALCQRYYTGIANGPIRPWDMRDRLFCNPPYSMLDLAISICLGRPNFSVWLLPQRPDNDWYRLLWESERVEMRPFRKRIPFLLNGELPKNPEGRPQGPRFASLLAIISSV